MFLSVCMVAAYAQLKVVAAGDVLIKNTGGTATADLDIPVNNNNRNNLQAGSFGIQSFADNNGFLTHNSYFDLGMAPGGNAMVMRKAGKGALAQFFDGRIIYRTIPNGAAGAVIPYIEGMVIQNNGNMQVGFPWTAPQADKLAVNGSVGATAFNVVSDRRLKENTSEFKYGLNEVLKLNPIHFQYNGEAGITDKSMHIGLYAQELKELVPEMVTEFQFEKMEVINDLAGEVRSGKKETYFRIKDNEIKYLLINAIKEQQEIIEDKEDRIADLEDRLLAIEDRLGELINQTDVNLGGGLSDAGSLGQNVPNPFNGETQISYEVPERATSAQMNIYDLNGRMLKTIPIQHTGKGRLNLTADQLPSGTYSYQLVVDNDVVGAKKMILSK